MLASSGTARLPQTRDRRAGIIGTLSSTAQSGPNRLADVPSSIQQSSSASIPWPSTLPTSNTSSGSSTRSELKTKPVPQAAPRRYYPQAPRILTKTKADTAAVGKGTVLRDRLGTFHENLPLVSSEGIETKERVTHNAAREPLSPLLGAENTTLGRREIHQALAKLTLDSESVDKDIDRSSVKLEVPNPLPGGCVSNNNVGRLSIRVSSQIMICIDCV